MAIGTYGFRARIIGCRRPFRRRWSIASRWRITRNRLFVSCEDRFRLAMDTAPQLLFDKTMALRASCTDFGGMECRLRMAG
jgi:hypothetical protein